MAYPYSLIDGGGGTTIDIESIFVVPTSTTSVEIRVSKVGMTEEPTKYRVQYVKLLENGVTTDGATLTLDFPVTDTTETPILQIPGLSAGRIYRFSVTAYKTTLQGITITDTIRVSETKFNGRVVGGNLDPGKISSSKGFLTISGPNVKSKFAIATKEFDAITLPSSSSIPLTGYWYIDEYVNSYSTKYYSFGTSLLFDNLLTNPKQGAGIGFFTNSEGTKGYFIVIESTSLAASQDRKSIRIIKTDGTKVFKLNDSQRSAANTFEGVFGGVQYNIDIKVKVSAKQVYITAYINGFKITAIDETGYNSSESRPNYIIDPTKNVSLLCSMGTTAFDYVYGTNIDEKQYADANYILNYYSGQFSNDLLNTTFGDLVYTGNYESDVYQQGDKSIEEFGTTVREIVKANIKFPSRPSFPIKWGTGNNRLVTLLSSKVSNFGGEAYVLNNSSTTIPLSDNLAASFYVLGNTLSPSGQLEYSTDESNTYTNKEPIIFESKWLQNLDDVKSLASWIKSNVVNKGKVVTMTVFGNPLISVGDIVKIFYTYNGFNGTEKFIVTNINHSYQEGLTTDITCRLIVN